MKIHALTTYLAGTLVTGLSMCTVAGQEAGPEPPAAGVDAPTVERPPLNSQASRASFDAVLGEWQDLLKEMREVQQEATLAEDSELATLDARYRELIAQGNDLIPRVRDAALEVYRAEPNQDREITRWLLNLAEDYVDADDYDAAWNVLQPLVDGQCEDAQVWNLAGITEFARHDFQAAKQYLQEAQTAGTLSTQAQNMLAEVDDYIQYWQQEQQLREQEAAAEEAGQIPRVRLQTSKGDLVLELFENEAPETVGNFVSLVENGFYDGVTFHRVLPGFMAQGGCPEGTGQGGPGYTIYCECHQPDYRKHFRGSISMAHAGRDTGGSQFFLTFLPTPHLNGRHTVFGRVVEGLDVLPKLQRRDPDKPEDLAREPDRIIKAEVIRKRDHKYVPNKVK
jgi:cyclophilin family peptidyl-prolyl cis-trans isomerase